MTAVLQPSKIKPMSQPTRIKPARIHLRPFRVMPFEQNKADYALLADMHNRIWPIEPLTPEIYAYFDNVRNKKYFFQRLILEVDGQPVGYASYQENYWSYRPGKYNMSIDILPEHRGQGVGSYVYDRIMDQLSAREIPPRLIEAGTHEDHEDGRRFLTKQGFDGPLMRWPLSKLDVQTFDASRFSRQVQGLTDHGLRIYSYREVAEIDPDYQERFYELDWECTQDEPQPDAPTRITFDEYVNRVFTGPAYLADGCFVAVDVSRPDRRYAGLTQLYMDSGSLTHLGTGFTCVRRDYRRKGVAVALKVHAIEWAKAQGTQSILTGNEEHNPMYQINLKLGYEPQPAGLHYHKVLDPTILDEIEVRSMESIHESVANGT